MFKHNLTLEQVNSEETYSKMRKLFDKVYNDVPDLILSGNKNNTFKCIYKSS